MFGGLEIVQIRHGKVGVAANPYLGQMHEGNLAASAIHRIPLFPCHFEKDAPLLLSRIRARLLGNVVAVI